MTWVPSGCPAKHPCPAKHLCPAKHPRPASWVVYRGAFGLFSPKFSSDPWGPTRGQVFGDRSGLGGVVVWPRIELLMPQGL